MIEKFVDKGYQNIMKKTVYLDYNATAPMRPEVFDFINSFHNDPLNASAIHSFGREGRRLVEDARTHIANTIGCPASQIIFNSGATEGNNTVLNHFRNDRILVSNIEHPSVLQASTNAEKIPVMQDGTIDLNALEKLLKEKQTALVSVMMVNNETGVMQPIEQISKIAKNHGALLHTDAVQALGRTAIDMRTMGIDFLTISGHKIGGPQGVGALALGLCGITPTLLHGGGQEKSARAGTENVAGIAGFGLATKTAKPTKSFQEKLEKFLQSRGAKIYGQNAERVSNTTLFSFPNLRAETALMVLDLEGIALSNGSACSSGTVQPSHVLKAMGVCDQEALSGLRISTGWATTKSDIDTFIKKFETFLQRTQN